MGGPSPSPLKKKVCVQTLSSCIPYYRNMKANVYEEVKISHQSFKTEGLHIPFGFLLLKISQMLSMECQSHEVAQPQGFPVSLQSWWYEAMCVSA